MFWQLDWCPVFGVSGSRCNMRASILVGVRTEPSLKLCGPRGLDTFPFVVEFCIVAQRPSAHTLLPHNPHAGGGGLWVR